MKKILIAFFLVIISTGLGFAAEKKEAAQKKPPTLRQLEREANKLERAKIKQKEKELKQVAQEQKLLSKQEIKKQKEKIKEISKNQKIALKEQRDKVKTERKEKRKADIAARKFEKQNKKEQKLAEKKQLKEEKLARKQEIKEQKELSKAEKLAEKNRIKNEKLVSDLDEKPENKELEPVIDKKVDTVPKVYKKNLTYEDIEKNAVSINEFLQFTDKQNEEFSIFYYKTTSKLKDYSEQIKAREKMLQIAKTTSVDSSAQYAKMRKIDAGLDRLYKERDDYYNKALKKFNHILTRRQEIKWEILQQMGYRFLPEFE